MRTDDFDYDLPSELIAQRPADPRDSSRLMVLNRSTSEIHHRVFHELPDLLNNDDMLVLNETRVIPARLAARKLPGGGKAELLLLEQEGPQVWRVLVGGKGLKVGRALEVVDGPRATVVDELEGPIRRVRFERPIEPLLDELGAMPLPPYIEEPLASPDEYQTVYAEHPGSAAAPTAGLHFTPELLERIDAQGVGIARVTLHVGLDTFLPVKEQDPRQHMIHTEWCYVPEEMAERIEVVRRANGRIITVGTTCVRTLETAVRRGAPDQVSAFQGATELYILPGFKFRAVDALITNFHLPRSTLLMLVSAFVGRDRILDAYTVAKEEGYRFYSFGDAMLIL